VQKIEEYVQGDSSSFFSDSMMQDAILRNFEVIGEAAKNLSENFKKEYSQVPWKKIAGFRDVLIHDYMGVDLSEVWNIIEQNLPDLKQEIGNLLKII
ncbi:MAG TPA: DUF86 domain-containing protein, partial [Deltaproteobacteria bacterium]|nr:DUF86 domain-containing protein [Deltaproteobacteria bacterium]